MTIEGLSENLVGKKVSLKTINNDTFEGVIYGFDQSQNCLALFETGGQNRARQSFKMFNAAYVASVTSLGDGGRDDLIEHFRKGDLPKINTEKLQERIDTAREKRSKSMGADVTIEAQDVFDAIERTLKCTWDKSTIVILDVVELPAPYQPENLKEKEGAGQRAHQTLEQVKKILKSRMR